MSDNQLATPQHIGIIMDGNRRWAQAHGKHTTAGHKAGFEALFALLEPIKERGIPYVTIYAFSTENWQRSKAEVTGLMRLLHWVVANKVKVLKEQGVKVVIIGDKTNLPAAERKALERAEAETAHNSELTLGVCFNYGGQHEIVDATRRILSKGVAAESVTLESFAAELYAPELPPLDLVVRTSGEQRLSNFMLWRAAYAELVFVDKYWPDYSAEDLDNVLAEYARRQRRHGK